MQRWILVVVVAVVGCKKPESACPAAKKEAAAAVEEAFFAEKLEVDKAKRAEEKAAGVAPVIRDAEKDLEVQLKLLEQSMDCLVKADCCARLPKMSYEGRSQVLQIGFGVKSPPKHQVQAIVAPLITHVEGNGLLVYEKTDPKSVSAWCTTARELIANIRRDAPAGWKAAIAEADKETAAAHATFVAQEQRLAKVREWAGALTKSKSAATPPELSSGGDSALEHAREAVARYQKCQ